MRGPLILISYYHELFLPGSWENNVVTVLLFLNNRSHIFSNYIVQRLYCIIITTIMIIKVNINKILETARIHGSIILEFENFYVTHLNA